MSRFYASCPAGLEALAARFAQDALADFRLERKLPGGLMFAAKRDRPFVGCFQNLYQSVALYEVRSLEEAALRACGDRSGLRRADEAMRRHGFGTYRVMFSDRNALAALAPRYRTALEQSIRAARVDRHKPETELLLLYRSEGIALLLLRLGMGGGMPAKGELAPALAYCVAALARNGRKREGVFLDPFAGHGALGWARLGLGGTRQVLLSDNDPAMIRGLQERLRRRPDGRVTIKQADALRLDEVYAPATVDEIACDPPWGLYAPLPLPAEVFYGQILAQFDRVLVAGGRLALLTADKQAFADALSTSSLELRERYDLLVNGKKAALFLAEKGEA